MASKRITGQDKRILKAFADRLPVIMDRTSERHIMKGSELKQMGYVFKPGENVKDDETRIFFQPVQVARNHYRRLKDAWEKNGQAGIQKYLNEIASLLKQHRS